jgi:hypothetical protein
MSISILMQSIPFFFKAILISYILLILFFYLRSAWKNTQKNLIHLQRLHQIPCGNCLFFTGEYNLKCAVHPCKALSEEAIGCADYQSAKIGLAKGNKV